MQPTLFSRCPSDAYDSNPLFSQRNVWRMVPQYSLTVHFPFTAPATPTYSRTGVLESIGTVIRGLP
jgi:hypothetical protein